MFEKTRSLLRTLTGGTATAEGDDRRRHHRFDTDTLTSFRTVSDDTPFSARVRNVSRSGVNILSPEEIPQGTMIRLDLPQRRGGPHITVLACVMNVRDDSCGGWSLGCMFSGELTSDELGMFGGEKKKSAPGDLRTWVRSPVRAKATYRVLPGEDDQLENECDLIDLSPAGAGLRLSEKVDPGTAISLTIPKNDGQPVRILACVVYLSEIDDSQDWGAGVNFIRELSNRELIGLM